MDILSQLGSIAAYGGTFLGIIVFIGLLGFIGLRFYTLASKEVSFVRTGVGGQKVVLGGGAFVIPGIHEKVLVNMKTLRLEVEKTKHDSLITADKLRIDVKAEFYVRVKCDEASVAYAATTLGSITMDPMRLKAQVEAKFVDALRSTAITMTMNDLNSERAKFVQQVQNVVAVDIAKNGLELESVSLTALNQTSKEFFDPTSVFDAEGLLVLTRETEARRKLVNDIEQQTRVEIETKNLEATKLQQALRKSTEEVKLTTNRDIANMTSTQESEIAAAQAAARKSAETATIDANREIETSRIEASRITEQAKVTADAAVTIRKQEQSILVADKSKEEAASKAAASAARALAVTAEETIETARQTEVAKRQKAVTLVKAEERAQEAATAITTAAKAEAEAATNRAEAQRVTATGDRDALELRASGVIAEGKAVAEALNKKNEAQNTLSQEQVAMQLRLAIIAALPAILAETVKPMMKIESIRIAELGGLGGATGATGANGQTAAHGSVGGQGGLSDAMVTSALRYRAHAPLVDGLMKEIGLNGAGNLNNLLAGVVGVGLAAEPAAFVESEPAKSAPIEEIRLD